MGLVQVRRDCNRGLVVCFGLRKARARVVAHIMNSHTHMDTQTDEQRQGTCSRLCLRASAKQEGREHGEDWHTDKRDEMPRLSRETNRERQGW